MMRSKWTWTAAGTAGGQACKGARCGRAHERPIRNSARHSVCAGSQPARIAYGAVRIQGHGSAPGANRGTLHGRDASGRAGRARGGRADLLRGAGIRFSARGGPVAVVNKVAGGRPHIVDMIKNGEVKLIINTVEERRTAIADSRSIRTSAVQQRVTYYTTIAGAG